jgi:CPA2 family monovalent cation:H+ antiporter-2
LRSVTLARGAKAVSRTLADIGLQELGVEVRALRRAQSGTIDPLPEAHLEQGDVLVLLGTADKLALAEARLL